MCIHSAWFNIWLTFCRTLLTQRTRSKSGSPPNRATSEIGVRESGTLMGDLSLPPILPTPPSTAASSTSSMGYFSNNSRTSAGRIGSRLGSREFHRNNSRTGISQTQNQLNGINTQIQPISVKVNILDSNNYDRHIFFCWKPREIV